MGAPATRPRYRCAASSRFPAPRAPSGARSAPPAPREPSAASPRAPPAQCRSRCAPAWAAPWPAPPAGPRSRRAGWPWPCAPTRCAPARAGRQLRWGDGCGPDAPARVAGWLAVAAARRRTARRAHARDRPQIGAPRRAPRLAHAAAAAMRGVATRGGRGRALTPTKLCPRPPAACRPPLPTRPPPARSGDRHARGEDHGTGGAQRQVDPGGGAGQGRRPAPRLQAGRVHDVPRQAGAPTASGLARGRARRGRTRVCGPAGAGRPRLPSASPHPHPRPFASLTPRAPCRCLARSTSRAAC
jgi:hypothetical protein